jgi:uncharacterized membrane protein
MRVSAWTIKRLNAVKESMWALPILIATLGVAAGGFMPWLDYRLYGDRGPTSGGLLDALVPGPSSADSLISTMLTGLTTILGVAFSVTVVTLQLAATQYTSRLLRRFMADPLTRTTLGIYIATIGYLAMVLRTIEPPSSAGGGFAPGLATMLGLFLFISCIVLLAVFIHHLARSIEAGPVVTGIARDTNGVLRRCQEGDGSSTEPAVPGGSPCHITNQRPGYLQLLEEEELLDALPEGCSVARVEARTGQFLIEGRPLVSLWPTVELDDRRVARIREAFALGAERTTHQDALYGIRQLVDVALKALSPAVNDVHTAVMVVNELGAVCDTLLKTTGGRPGGSWRCVARGKARVYLPQLDLDTFLTHAFDELPRAAAAHPIVIARLLEAIAELVEKYPHPGVRARLWARGERISEFLSLGEFVPSEEALLRKKQDALSRGMVLPELDVTNPV